MMLEILVTHLEKVCGLDQKTLNEYKDKPRSHRSRNLSKPIEDTNLEEII